MKICKSCGRLLKDSEFTSKQSICKYCKRQYFLWKTYKITEEQYTNMWKKQKGKCAICGKDLKEHYLDVDHDHETGKVRGLLCRYCNWHLDKITSVIKESSQALLEYLERAMNEQNSNN